MSSYMAPVIGLYPTQPRNRLCVLTHHDHLLGSTVGLELDLDKGSLTVYIEGSNKGGIPRGVSGKRTVSWVQHDALHEQVAVASDYPYFLIKSDTHLRYIFCSILGGNDPKQVA